MGRIRRIWEVITNKEVPYVDETQPADDSVSVKDLLRFMEKQQEQTSQLMTAMLTTSASQARTMETYIELFKPKEMKSSTLEEREALRDKVHVREEEFEGITSVEQFNKFLGGNEIPPDPSEW